MFARTGATTEDLEGLVQNKLFTNHDLGDTIANLSSIPLLVDLFQLCREMKYPPPPVDGMMRLGLENTLSLINRIVPINEEASYQNQYDDGEGEECLYADSSYSFYSFEQFCEEVEECLHRQERFEMNIPSELLYYALNYGMDEDVFRAVTDTFGWQLVIPRFPDRVVDTEKFYGIISAISKDVAMTFRLYFQDIPNLVESVYLPDESDYARSNTVPFNKRGLRQLMREYRKLKPYFEARDRCDVLLRDNPDLVNNIFEAWIEAQGDKTLREFYSRRLNGTDSSIEADGSDE